MKKFAIGLIAGWALVQAGAGAEESQWLTDLSKAQARAKGEKKMVLMDFTGSDWCPPCKALNKNVLSTPQFLDYARKNLVLVEVDFPKHKSQTEEQKKANQQLSEKFGVEGYPTVVVLSGEGKELKKDTGYSGQSVEDFIADLEKLKKQA